jgi:hypothetical protein
VVRHNAKTPQHQIIYAINMAKGGMRFMGGRGRGDARYDDPEAPDLTAWQSFK